MNKLQTFESLWTRYVEKLARIDELTRAGRYGYQLRMPRLAVRRAHKALHEWCGDNNLECPCRHRE